MRKSNIRRRVDDLRLGWLCESQKSDRSSACSGCVREQTPIKFCVKRECESMQVMPLSGAKELYVGVEKQSSCTFLHTGDFSNVGGIASQSGHFPFQIGPDFLSSTVLFPP